MGKKTNQNSVRTSGNNTGLKLPTVRKLHIKPSYIICGIIAVLIAAFLARVVIWEHFYFERMEGSERASASVYEDSDEEIDDTQPTTTDVAEYTVAPNRPRYLSIASLGISNARVVEIGLRANGALSTPANVYNVGWYRDSALPGSAGVVVMDGHGGTYGSGVFKNLPSIQVGAEITVEMGDGRLFTYRVAEVATKALGEEADAYMSYAFTTPQAGAGALTLITCTGDWWQSSKTYSHRFFMRAVLVD